MKGERKSKRRGSSVEFADHRNYTVGDDLRHIDWNVYGRLDKLFLKLFLEEEDLHFYTLLDTSLSMDFGTPTKLHYGKQVAAALAFIGLVNHDRVILDTFASELDQGMPERPGPVADVARGRSTSTRSQASGESDLKAAAQGVRHQARRARASSSSSPTSWTSAATRTPSATCSPGTWTSTSSTSSARRRSSPSSSATSGWSTSRTTTSPRSPSAPRC